jgi:FtsP/CotA-like multicopper oxidase with cupredoxin domain
MIDPSTWILNSSPHQGFRQQLPPLLWNNGSRGDTSYGAQGTLKNGSVVDIIFRNDQHVDSMHPFHKHNAKAWVIGQGYGGFPYDSVDAAFQEDPSYARYFNFDDPPLRDGCRLEKGRGAWTVIRYEILFPAASMLHCHMIHHFASGQQVILLEGTEAMERIPEEMHQRVHADFIPPVRYGPLE